MVLCQLLVGRRHLGPLFELADHDDEDDDDDHENESAHGYADDGACAQAIIRGYRGCTRSAGCNNCCKRGQNVRRPSAVVQTIILSEPNVTGLNYVYKKHEAGLRVN